jgi:antitoxin (DNA-binding transcriptional repressor) of toxin-antitoxin stability system
VSEIELHVAELYLDRIIERVEAGETIAITRDGVRVAIVAPAAAASRPRARPPATPRTGGAAAAAGPRR